jgi:hypothetical protein
MFHVKHVAERQTGNKRAHLPGSETRCSLATLLVGVVYDATMSQDLEVLAVHGLVT